MQPLGAVAHPEHRAELTEPPRRQPVARRQEQLLAGEARVQRADALEVLGVARVVAPVALAHALVRRPVDVVGRTRDAAGARR